MQEYVFEQIRRTGLNPTPRVWRAPSILPGDPDDTWRSSLSSSRSGSEYSSLSSISESASAAAWRSRADQDFGNMLSALTRLQTSGMMDRPYMSRQLAARRNARGPEPIRVKTRQYQGVPAYDTGAPPFRQSRGTGRYSESEPQLVQGADGVYAVYPGKEPKLANGWIRGQGWCQGGPVGEMQDSLFKPEWRDKPPKGSTKPFETPAHAETKAALQEGEISPGTDPSRPWKRRSRYRAAVNTRRDGGLPVKNPGSNVRSREEQSAQDLGTSKPGPAFYAGVTLNRPPHRRTRQIQPADDTFAKLVRRWARQEMERTAPPFDPQEPSRESWNVEDETSAEGCDEYQWPIGQEYRRWREEPRYRPVERHAAPLAESVPAKALRRGAQTGRPANRVPAGQRPMLPSQWSQRSSTSTASSEQYTAQLAPAQPPALRRKPG